MKYLHSRFDNITFAEAVAKGYDLVQAKARGEACEIRIADGKVDITGYNGYLLTSFTIENTTIITTFLGVYFPVDKFPQQLTILLDCILVGEHSDTVDGTTSLVAKPYRERFGWVKTQLALIDLPQIKPVVNYRIDKAGELWDHLDMTYSNGIIYRKSSDHATGKLYAARKYKEVPGGLP